MIKGIEKLNQEEIDFIQEVNQMQQKAFGFQEENKEYQIIEVWKDENNTLCVRLRNGDFYHYLSNKQWY